MQLARHPQRAALRGAARPARLSVVRPQASAAATAATPGTTKAYEALRGVKLIRSSDGALVDLPSLWGPGERAVVAFARSMG